MAHNVPLVFIDADVLFAGAASPQEYGASYVLLRMAEITLIDAIASDQVIEEAERNLGEKIPQALPSFRMLVSRCLRVVATPGEDELVIYQGLADPKDLPILVAAIRENCPWLVTFNIGDYQPGHKDVTVMRPGRFLSKVRGYLSHLHWDNE
jgi:hypothetical protein